MGEVVSLTIQLSLPGAGPAGGAMLRDSFSRHSSRSACSIREQARRSAIGSPVSCAKAIPLTPSSATARRIAFIATPAVHAPDDQAIPAPLENGRDRAPSQRD